MKYHAEFNHNGIVPCGSDSIFVLDGRNNLETMVDDCKQYIDKKRKVTTFNGFTIYRGDLKSRTVIYHS